MEIPRMSSETSRKKEVLFKGILVNKLFDAIKEGMEEADVPEKTITSFFDAVKNLPEEDILSTLAIPKELQPKLFSRFAEQLENKKTTTENFVQQLLKRVKEKGYRLGFHVSNKDIEPTELPDKDSEEGLLRWEINGSEQDHRDDDLLRAYYSFDYQNLYRVKSGNYLYLIRAETGPSTPHKKDNDGAWGRASTLSIITRLNLKEIDTQIDHMIEQSVNQNKEIKKAA